jgi:hypothetical protein
MKRCRTCRWWDDRNTDRPGWGHCGLTASENGRPAHETKAVALDFESYGASLETAPDFGCVQWKGKEPR